MIRAHKRIGLSGFALLALVSVACHKTAPPARNSGPPSVAKDTVRVAVVVKDTARVVEIFRDTVPTNVLSGKGRTFRLQTRAQRDSLRATLRKERGLWDARKPRDYRFLLRVDCFCPGRRGWLLIEVRNGQLVRASDGTGKSVPLTDWNTFTIDWLYTNLERSVDSYRDVKIAFDSQRHFPTYVSSSTLPGPDAWSIIEVRELRPI